MQSRINIVVVLLVCFGGAGRSFADDKPRARLELRLAEKKAGISLKAMTLPKSGEKVYVHVKAEITNEHIADASIEEDLSGRFSVRMQFTKQGSARIEKLTKKHVNKLLAVLLDGKILTAPVIRERISEQALISGLTKSEAKRIVDGLNAK